MYLCTKITHYHSQLLFPLLPSGSYQENLLFSKRKTDKSYKIYVLLHIYTYVSVHKTQGGIKLWIYMHIFVKINNAHAYLFRDLKRVLEDKKK